MQKFYSTPCRGGMDDWEHTTFCGCGRSIIDNGVWYFPNEIRCPAATNQGCTGNPNSGQGCENCDLNPTLNREKIKSYYCASCAIETSGNFHGRSYPTCDNCDSDILVPVNPNYRHRDDPCPKGMHVCSSESYTCNDCQI
jgi:hypothetical protein